MFSNLQVLIYLHIGHIFLFFFTCPVVLNYITVVINQYIQRLDSVTSGKYWIFQWAVNLIEHQTLVFMCVGWRGTQLKSLLNCFSFTEAAWSLCHARVVHRWVSSWTRNVQNFLDLSFLGFFPSFQLLLFSPNSVLNQ